MLLSRQQKYILEVLKQLKCLRFGQLHALVRAHYRAQGVEIGEERMAVMLRQLQTLTNFIRIQDGIVSYGDREADPRRLEAVDVMLELTEAKPVFYSVERLRAPLLLRFFGGEEGTGYLFSVAWLDAATGPAAVPRMKGERIIWLSDCATEVLTLPRHQFFAARQEDGTHRFYGSDEP